ncbi:8-oxo-dGTP diphosphatase MutT [Wenyingzhuangia sp. IMCC45574]
MIIVAAGILIKEHKVFIARRKQGKHLAGFWEFPGGKIEEGEISEETIVREFLEEFDVGIKVKSRFYENVYKYPEKEVLLKSLLIEYVSGEFKLKDHNEFAWVAISDLKNYKIAPADLPIVNKLEAIFK